MLSIIIVNYKSEKYLAKCIFSIKEKILNVEHEIIVINNDNLDIQCPSGVGLINSDKNIGFGAACNVGAKKAQGELLWFLNPDTEIVSSNISELIHDFDENGRAAIIGPKLITSDGKTQKWIAGEEITIVSTILNNLGYTRDQKIWESENLVECAWVSAAAMFIKKDVFEKLGGFDEKFFMYFEDIDLCQRARKLGYKILYFPEFAIKHIGGGSFISKIKQKKYYYKAQFKYFLKQTLL